MNNHKIFRQMYLIVFMLLSACGSSGSSPDVTLTELSTNVISYDDIVRINNCGGKADSEQTQSRSFATTFEGGIGLSAGYQSIAEGSISAKYSQYRNTTKSQRLIAPPGTNMEFVIRWSEEVRAGNVRIDGSSADYEVRIPISVEQISSRDLGNCGENPVIPVQPTSIPSQPNSNVIMSQTELLGEWLYQQPRLPMPAPAGENQVIFAHGDINNTGTCHVKEFKTGETVQGLGLGSFKLWRITGTAEYIKDVEAQLQKGAAAHAGTDCPYLP
jgi:hypothetical protein